MNEIGQAYVRIRPNTLGFKQETEAGVKSGLSGISKIVGSALAVGTAAEIAKSLVKTAQDHEKAFAIVRSTIKATDSAWVVHGQTVQEVLRKQAVALGFNDEELAKSFTRIQLGTQDTAKSLKILGEAESLSRASGKELGVTALALVRAYQGAGQSLRRFGIIIAPITAAQDKLNAAHDRAIQNGAKFSAAQNLTFKGYLEQAKALDKQATTTNVLAEVQRRAGEAATVFAKTSAGQFAILGENIHLLKEEAGKGLLPTLNDAAGGLSHLIATARESDTLKSEFHGVADAVRSVVHGIGDAVQALSPVFNILEATQEVISKTVGGGGIVTLILAWKSLAFVTATYSAAQLRANSIIAAGSSAAAREAAATKSATTAVAGHTAAVNTNTASVARNNAALESGASIQGAEAARLARIAAAERSAAGFRAVGSQGVAISPFLFGGGSRLIRNSANENLTTTAALTRAIKQQEAAIKLDADASAILAGKLAVTSHVMRDGGLAITDASGKVMLSSREFGEAEKKLEGFGGTVSSVGSKVASFGRGLLSIGASLAPQIAIAGLAFGIYKLVTAETAWDRANKAVSHSLDALANSTQRLRNAQNDLKAAQETLPTDRLALSEARLNLTRARTAFLTTNAKKGSDAYRQAQIDLTSAILQVQTAQKNVTQDSKAAADAQGRIGIFTRRSAGDARDAVKAFATLARTARADVQARRVPQLPGEAAALAAGKFADEALERSRHAKSVIERRNDEIIAAYARQLKSIPPPKTIELILSNKNAKATLASLLAGINAGIPSGIPVGFRFGPAHGTGAVIGGSGSGDTVPAMLTPGEVVLNHRQQQTLLGKMGMHGGADTLFGAARFANGGTVPGPLLTMRAGLRDAQAHPGTGISRFGRWLQLTLGRKAGFGGAIANFVESLDPRSKEGFLNLAGLLVPGPRGGRTPFSRTIYESERSDAQLENLQYELYKDYRKGKWSTSAYNVASGAIHQATFGKGKVPLIYTRDARGSLAGLGTFRTFLNWRDFADEDWDVTGPAFDALTKSGGEGLFMHGMNVGGIGGGGMHVMRSLLKHAAKDDASLHFEAGPTGLPFYRRLGLPILFEDMFEGEGAGYAQVVLSSAQVKALSKNIRALALNRGEADLLRQQGLLSRVERGLTNRHAGGGIIGGVGSGDTVPAMLTPGEMVLNRRQQRNLFGDGGVANPNRLFSMIDAQHFATGGVSGGGGLAGTSPVFFGGIGGGLGALERMVALAFSGAAAAVGAAAGAAARKAATQAAEAVAAAPKIEEADRKIAAHHKLIADLTAQIRAEAKTLPRVAGQDLSEAIALGIVSKNGVVINAVTSQMTDAVKAGIKAVNDSIVSAKQNLNAIGGSLSNDITTLLGKTGGTSEPSGPLAAQFHKLMARIRAGDASSETARAAQTLANELAAAQTVRSARTGGTQSERITRHIADLTDELNKGAISMAVFRKRVEGTLGSAGVTPGKAQKTLGVAFADQLRADIAGIFEQAKAILATPGHGFGGTGLAPTIVRPLEQIKIEQRNVAEAAKSQRDQMIQQQKSALSTAKSQLKELQKIRASLKATSANDEAAARLKYYRQALRHPRAAAEALAGADNNYTRP